MFPFKLRLAYLSLIMILGGWGCISQNSQNSESQSPNQAINGELILVANGENFIRQGFTSKDGWQIQFDHVHVNLNNVKAYQTDPPFDPHSKSELKAKETVIFLEKPQIVDLAEGDINATPIVVKKVTAPLGNYNSLSWQVDKSNDEKMAGSTLILVGQATKDSQTVNFALNFQEKLSYACGEFVGDERKGYLGENRTTELEITLHFDHLFGDGNIPPEDEMNLNALGFNPLANLAQNGQLTMNQTTLKQKLSSTDFDKLQNALKGLGHVGEGHCRYQG